jgi:hypothetical protein
MAVIFKYNSSRHPQTVTPIDQDKQEEFDLKALSSDRTNRAGQRSLQQSELDRSVALRRP